MTEQREWTKVKPLEWRKTALDHAASYGLTIRMADIAIGTYRVVKGRLCFFTIWFDAVELPGVFEDVDVAKIAAQADYEARILSALIPAEPPVAGWMEIDDRAVSGERILLLWKPVGGLSEHVELGRFSQSATGWVNTYGKPFSAAPDKWAPLAPFATPPTADLQAEVDRLKAELRTAADQLKLAHDDAFRQCAGYGLVTADGRDFSCFQLNQCGTAATAARAALGESQ